LVVEEWQVLSPHGSDNLDREVEWSKM